MCGLAGIMFKTGGNSNDTGKALIDILDGCQHRGPDSTGFALYSTDTEKDRLHLRFYVGPAGSAQGQKIAGIKGILVKHGAAILTDGGDRRQLPLRCGIHG